MKQLFSGEAQEWVIRSAESSKQTVGKTDMYNAVMGQDLHGISSGSHIDFLMRGPGTLA